MYTLTSIYYIQKMYTTNKMDHLAGFNIHKSYIKVNQVVL